MKKMKILMTILCVTFMALGMASSVAAYSITPGSGVIDISRWEGNETSTSVILGKISGIMGFDAAANELFKDESMENLNVGAWDITFDVLEPAGVYLLVKDGNHEPAWYLFDLMNIPSGVGWNGTDTIEVTSFWPNGGAISHVSLYGPTAVPEPMTLILLGFGLLGLAGIRRD